MVIGEDKTLGVNNSAATPTQKAYFCLPIGTRYLCYRSKLHHSRIYPVYHAGVNSRSMSGLRRRYSREQPNYNCSQYP